MSSPQASRKHHFIPAFYTSRWSTEGKLIQWSKPYRDIKPLAKHPNATGFEYDLYSFNGLALPIHDDLRFGAYAAFGTSGRTGSFGFFTA